MADPLVETVVANWAPRFVAQGVDYNDYLRTTARVERWEQWLDAWRATGDLHHELAVEAAGRGRDRSAGEAHLRAALCYHFAKFVWVLDPARHRETAELAVSSFAAALRRLDPGARRLEVPFDGGRLVATLRRPPDRTAAVPVVLLIPGLDSTKEEFFHWENVFLARGLATVSLDGPGQGEGGYELPIRPDYETAVGALLDDLAARGDPGLDLGRVGAAGVSLGGYYAPRAAAHEPRLAAVAAIGGPYNFGELWPSLPAVTRAAFRHYGKAADDDARALALRLDLDGVAPRVTQPLLAVTGAQDRLIPVEQVRRLAAEAPNAELVVYPEGNHVCNNIPYKYRPLVADWLAEHLGARPDP